MKARWWLWLLIVCLGTLANLPAIQLPLVTPFLPGHMALLLLVRIAGGWPALLALPLICLPVLGVAELLASVLQLLLLWLSLRTATTLRAACLLSYLPLHAVLSWPLLPALLQNDWRWFLLFNLLSSAMFWFNCSASQLIAGLLHQQQQTDKQPLARLLANRLTLYSVVPATLLLAVLLHAATVLDLSRQLLQLQHEQKTLALQISNRVAAYLADVSLLARQVQDQTDLTQVTALLKQLSRHRQEYISALVAAPDGLVKTFYKSDVPTGSPGQTSVADRQYFRLAMASTQAQISDTFIGRGLGTDPLVSVSQQLKGPAQQGVLAVAVDLNALTKAIAVSNPQVSHRILLDSQQQKIWATGDNRPLGERWSVSSRSEAMPTEFLRHSWFNSFGAVSLSHDGVHFILDWPLAPAGWRLLYYQDTYQAMVRYQGYLALTLLLAFLMLQLNTRLANQFAGKFTQALSDLANQASQWQPGQAATPARLDYSASEVQSLQLTIQAMQQRVSDSYQAQQQAMTQLVDLNEALELRVASRTAELAQERDKAQQLARVKSRFLANMSHEIRTPITVISGFTEQLAQQLSGEPKQMLQKIQLNSRHLQQLVDDILDTSQLEEGKMQLHVRPFLLASLLDEVVLQISPLLAAKPLQLVQDYSPAAQTVLSADPFRLKQILLNLLSNAVKFTDSGQICLRFRSQPDMASLSVIDQGIGISPAQLDKLFHQFSQADSGTNRQFGGSGLGLYISRQLAQAMQMTLTVHSQPGQGSEFSLQMPATLLAAAGNTPCQQQLGTPADIRLVPARILLVDDVADIRALLQSYLADQPVTVTGADSGYQALSAVQHAGIAAYDVVVLDQQMPGLDGIATARLLLQAGLTCPMLLLSADALIDNPQAMHLFAQFLTKPISKTTFLQAIATALQNTTCAARTGPTAADDAPHLPAQVTLMPDLRQHSPGPVPSEGTDPSDDALLAQYRNSLPAMQQRLQQAQLDELRLLAHQIKGTSACFGLQELSAAAALLQQQLSAGTDHQQALQALQAQLQQQSQAAL